MASTPNLTIPRAVRLGRSSLTGQFVLKPVGNPTAISPVKSGKTAEFTVSERLVLNLAAQRLSSQRIADKLGVSLSMVNSTLERAKQRYAVKTRIDAARQFVHANKRAGLAG